MIKMLKNKKTVILIIYIFVNAMLLCSCTGGKEIKDLALVTAIGLDVEDDNVVLTCEISNPLFNLNTDASSSASVSVMFVQGKGKTLFEAITNTSLNFERRLFFSHAEVLIIGEEFAKKGITQNLDYLLRAQEPRENIKMVVAKGTKAYEVMGISGELSASGGQYINEVLEKFVYNGKTININLAQYFRYYYSISNEPVIGVVQKEIKERIDKEKKKFEPTETILNVGGGAVTKRDYLIGYFTPEEMLGFNFIVDDIKSGIIVINTPDKLNKNISVIGDSGKFTSIEILKSRTKKDIKIKDGKIHLDLNVKLRGSLIEENKAIDMDDEEIIKLIGDACSKEIKKVISNTLNKGQKEFKQDNFSIGETLHHQHPKVWKEIAEEWEDIFTDITYSINVESEIVKIGMINVPSNLRKRR
jgi:spore germination protein KC